jgi:uncharacterized membrane protein YhaH (DUF805 family)
LSGGRDGLFDRAFRPEGRFTQWEFARTALPVIAKLILANVALAIVHWIGRIGLDRYPAYGAVKTIAALVMVGWLLFALPLLIGATVRRLNDLGWPGWWAAGLFIPPVNVVLLVVLVTRRGVPRPPP